MPITGIFSQRRPSIGGVFFDASIAESTQLTTDVSQFPLEDGTVISDHVIQAPLRLSMTVGVSDNFFRSARAQFNPAVSTLGSNAVGVAIGSALGALGGAGAAVVGIGASIANGQAETRSQTILNYLRLIQSTGQLIDVVTSKASYKNCAVVDTYQETNKQNEGGLLITVQLVQVNIINQQTASANVATLPPGDSASFMGQSERNVGNVSLR